VIHQETLSSQQDVKASTPEALSLLSENPCSRNLVSLDLREEYCSVICTQPTILHARRSLNSKTERT
jgi:hypothetical protein